MTAKHYGKSYYERFLFQPKLNSQRIRTHLQELLAYKPGGRLFEIGCGRGEFLTAAKERFDVQGMDLSDYAVRIAAERTDGRVIQGNIETANIQSRHYDAIVAFNIFEHLRQPGHAIQKVFDGLRDDGVLMGSVPLNYAVLGSIHTLLTNIFDPTHVSTFNPEKWRGLFEQAGFRMVRFFGELTIGQNRHIYVREPLWPFLSFNLMFVCRK